MYSEETVVEIRVLVRQGKTIRQIVRETGLSRNTVRKYLRDASAPVYGPRLPRPSKLDPFREYLADRVASAAPAWIPATVLLREIEALGYTGGISQLKVLLAKMKPKAAVEPLVRFETAPGEQMQADFQVLRRGRDRLSAFTATLGYSRYAFVHYVTDERIDTVLSCLWRTFEAFGGVPRHVLFDNMKTVVLQRDAYGEGRHRFHPQLLQLSRDFGFSIRLCRPYRARTKGKVERFNRYHLGSFWIPLLSRMKACGLGVDAEMANREAVRWLREVANVRVHGELGERPVDRWMYEKAFLLPYHDSVRAAPPPGARVPVPIESLQHPLSTYDALVIER